MLSKNLDQDQKKRYLRNIILNEIGEAGQKKLLNAKILVVGAGGLGSAALFYLAAAGIGSIGIIDDDEVELSNLQRQIIHNEKDLGKKKILSAARKISELNSQTKVQVFDLRIDASKLAKISVDYDLILDATDNFESRFAINLAAHQQKKPLIFAAVKGFLGQVSVFKSYEKNNPCYACFNPNSKIEPQTETQRTDFLDKGILGSVAGTIGSIQATAAIKEFLQIGESLVGKILIFDFLKNDFRKTNLKKNLGCKICCS